MKRYLVCIKERWSHGKYGKKILQTWYLDANSKQKAINFAIDIVAGMKWIEISEDYPYLKMDRQQTIGYDNAEKWFSYEAILKKERKTN